jgi:hypothetical protein
MNLYYLELIVWLIAGMAVLIASPTRYTYFCAWLALILNILLKIHRQ